MEKPVKFDKIPWENPDKGIYQKVYSNSDTTVRLVKFDHNFIEKEWCFKNHLGYILKGQLKLDFDGLMQTYNKGEALILNSGEKHKIITDENTDVEIILFEKK